MSIVSRRGLFASLVAVASTAVAKRKSGTDKIDPSPAEPLAGMVGAHEVWVRQPVAAAVPQRLSRKVEHYVDVQDFMTPEMREDVAAGTLKVDSSPAFQAALDFASRRGEISFKAGCRLRIPGGRYLISRPLEYVWRRQQRVIDDGDMRRLTLEGDGQANTVIFYSGDADKPALQVDGYTGGRLHGSHMRIVIRGIRLARAPRTNGIGRGLAFDGVAWAYLDDVDIMNFDCNVFAVDTLRFLATNSNFSGARLGFIALGKRYSNPNIFKFLHCSFGGNRDCAAEFRSPANLSFDSCSFEGNGGENKGRHCVVVKDGPSEGGASASFNNCYFESNNVYSDVELAWSTSDWGTVSFSSCSFQRISATRFSDHHILVSAKGDGRPIVRIVSCAFKHMGEYSPAASRGVLSLTPGDLTVVSSGNYFQSPVEAPTSRQIKTGMWQNGVACFAYVKNRGVPHLASYLNIMSVHRISRGQVRLSFSQQMDMSELFPTLTMVGSPGSAFLMHGESGYCDIGTVDSAGEPTDASFVMELRARGNRQTTLLS